QQRDARAEAEAGVLEVIESRESLIGTLEGEKIAIESTDNADGTNDYEALRVEAQQWIDQFNENGGQYYEGNDLFGDDWDESEVDFDRLANRFFEKPDLLEDFANVQGRNDGELSGKSADEIEQYLSDLDDPELATKISLRHQAAAELTGIYE